jgi:hypothetical protein
MLEQWIDEPVEVAELVKEARERQLSLRRIGVLEHPELGVVEVSEIRRRPRQRSDPLLSARRARMIESLGPGLTKRD